MLVSIEHRSGEKASVDHKMGVSLVDLWRVTGDPTLAAKTTTRRGWGTRILLFGVVQRSQVRHDKTAPNLGHPDL